ncbi:zinc finger protein 62 homolog [Ruditapes philippinarum]|uniref:zinc finger protein 62 homolog n=1 Tax=Ruditapes philippinarum TaxID=129788 RepID=UPI00295B8406|nr:zinc finger protein 62 homolog [Ruditapes philippinarum]
MNHICTETNCYSNKLGPFTCGVCSKVLSSICLLHQHLTGHSSGGSYHFDNVLRVAFPKYDSICASTQTPGQQDYLLDERFSAKVGLLEDIQEKRMNYAKYHRHFLGSKDKEAVKFVKELEKPFKNEHRVRVENHSADLTSANTRYRDLTGKQQIRECASTENESKFASKASKLSKKIDTKNSEEKLILKSSSVAPDFNVSSFVNDNDDNTVGDNDDVDSDKSDNEQNMFRIPNSFPKKRRKRMAVSEIVDKTMRNKSGKERVLKRFTKKEKKKPNKFKTEVGNLETEFSNDDESDCEKIDTVHDNKNKTDYLEDNNYFYGKLISKSFTIERQKWDEKLGKGEMKSEPDQIVVDGTWYPEFEESYSLMPNEKSGHDEFEISKIKDFYGIDTNVDLPKEELKKLKKEWRNEPKSELNCRQCGKTFKHIRHFEGHMNFHAGLTPFMCQYCGKAYANLTSLQMHEKLIHSDKSTWLQCSVCENSFATPGRLRTHQLTHSTDYSYICNICNKSYKNHTLLKRHQSYAHSNKQHRCQNCRLSFNTIEERDLHQCVKHNKEMKCETCGRQFTSERSKIRHEKIHSGVKPHECHICLRRFLQKSPYWVHMEKHHDLTKTDLIRLFPEKHLGRNQQHLIKEMTPTDNLDKYDEISDDSFVDEEISNDPFVDDDELLFASPVNLTKL